LEGNVPKVSLANGLWLGEVPTELSALTFMERLMVARVRHCGFYVTVASSGMKKMLSHVIAFESPVEQIYHELPPPRKDMDEVLCVMFSCPQPPEKEDFQRTPLLVNRRRVLNALHWLRLNHSDYRDISVSEKNLLQYSEDEPVVQILYQQSDILRSSESLAVYEYGDEGAVETGECPFVVHGLVGDSTEAMTSKQLKAIALCHFNENRPFLHIPSSQKPASIYNNIRLYPQMFPWLFPYGLGNLGSGPLSESEHRRYLLNYFDKQFQLDTSYVLVNFSHTQIKNAVTGGHLAIDRKNFPSIAEHLLKVNISTMKRLSEQMFKGISVLPITEEEKLCFQVIQDLDVVASHVPGSLTTKKHMRSDLWSLVACKDAPSIFLTFSPADNYHPICLYFADTKEKFIPNIRRPDEHWRLIANNPVACAQFFHLMVTLFIKYVLGWDSDIIGLFGKLAAFYGVVEQQGCLTLHLHTLLWLKGNMSPQNIKENLMKDVDGFGQCIIDFLQSIRVGEFLTGPMDNVIAARQLRMKISEYTDPCQILPIPPPEKCILHANDANDIIVSDCDACKNIQQWTSQYQLDVDDILLRVNVHDNCTSNLDKKGLQKKNVTSKGCLDNKWGVCSAHFPRELHSDYKIDHVSGILDLKKKEAWMNDISPPLTYLIRSNTDWTPLFSGTAIKAVIIYTTNYVAKTGLKTWKIMSTVMNCIQQNTHFLNYSNISAIEITRKLQTQIVNQLVGKLEIGGPFASLYSLGYPDFYSSHKGAFKLCYWTILFKRYSKCGILLIENLEKYLKKLLYNVELMVQLLIYLQYMIIYIVEQS
jgi:hypothetical protein